jgi:hypothetical protein
MYSQNCSILVNGNKPFAKNNDLQKEWLAEFSSKPSLREG